MSKQLGSFRRRKSGKGWLREDRWMYKFMRQPICSLKLKAKRLITVYGLRLDCALKGQRKQATSLLRGGENWPPSRQNWHFSASENLLLCNKASFNASFSSTHERPRRSWEQGAGCPTAVYAKHYRVNRGFLTVNKQESERDISAEPSKLNEYFLSYVNLRGIRRIKPQILYGLLVIYGVLAWKLFQKFFPICYG